MLSRSGEAHRTPRVGAKGEKRASAVISSTSRRELQISEGHSKLDRMIYTQTKQKM